MFSSRRLRVMIRATQRKLSDAFSSMQFSRPRNQSLVLLCPIEVTQPFTASATLQQKRHNLKLAAQRIAHHTIAPGEVFSFWRAVGNPNGDDFESSRSIVAGKLQIERGGGLCQASGIIYHLSLIAGLEVVERHSHSVDLYTEETRFCPLGSDATVFYGYKDLRLRNNSCQSIRFELEVGETEFVGRLLSETPIPQRPLTFKRIDNPDGTLSAQVVNDNTGEVISTSHYQRLE